MLPWFFMFPYVLHCCLHIWSSSHLLQALLTDLFQVSNLGFFFLLQWCARTSPLGFGLRQRLSGLWVTVSVSVLQEVLDHVKIHSWDRGLCFYYLTYRWVRSPWVPWCTVPKTEPKPNGTMVGKSVAGMWACLLKTALLVLRWHCVWQSPRLDRCQIVVVGGIRARDILFTRLADTPPRSPLPQQCFLKTYSNASTSISASKGKEVAQAGGRWTLRF